MDLLHLHLGGSIPPRPGSRSPHPLRESAAPGGASRSFVLSMGMSIWPSPAESSPHPLSNPIRCQPSWSPTALHRSHRSVEDAVFHGAEASGVTPSPVARRRAETFVETHAPTSSKSLPRSPPAAPGQLLHATLSAAWGLPQHRVASRVAVAEPKSSRSPDCSPATTLGSPSHWSSPIRFAEVHRPSNVHLAPARSHPE